jgi:hypothetical protein
MAEPLAERVDHVRGAGDASVILEYGQTIFIDGFLYEGGYEPGDFLEALAP